MRRKVAIGLTLALACSALCAVGVSSATALTFCPNGAAAGQCATGFEGVASDFGDQRVYVADKLNNRVDVFAVEGGEVKFKFAFGWGVADGTTSALQTCTVTCFKGLPGTGAGQMTSPTWIAIDNSAGPSHHDVYLTDANQRVQKFDQSGNFIWTVGSGVNTGTSGKPNLCTNAGAPTDVCGPGTAGTGVGQLEEVRGLGVSGSGQVYVVDTKATGNCQGDPNKGSQFLKRVHKYGEGGGEEGEVLPSDVPCGGVRGFAVDAAGEYWVASTGNGAGLRKYTATGTAATCNEDLDVETAGLSIDATGHLLAAQADFGGGLPSDLTKVVAEFDVGPCPAHLSRFGYGQVSESAPKGLAALTTTLGDVLASQFSGEVNYLKAPGPGPLAIYDEPPPPSLIGNTKATVKAVVNPEGAETHYYFQWVDDADYQANVADSGDGFEGVGVAEGEAKVLATSEGEFSANATAPTVLGCPDPTEQAIEEGKCLVPATEYHWRVVATNAANPAGSGSAHLEGPTFTTKPALEAQAFSSGVGITSATLSATVNPLNIPTEGIFEYVTEAEFQVNEFTNAIKVPDPGAGETKLKFGEDEGPVRRSRVVFDLSEGTTYRYRLVAGNRSFGQIPTEPGTLTTYRTPSAETSCPNNQPFRTGASATLPDCRAYEMVSPLDKEGADIIPLAESFTNPATLDQSAGEGDRFTYGAYRAFGDSPSAPYTAQYLASRGAEGWESQAISPPKGQGIEPAAVPLNEYFWFSEGLCQGVLNTFSEPTLAAGGLPGYFNIYRREGLCGGQALFNPVTTAEPEHQDGTNFNVELQGVSVDGATVAFAATDNLKGSLAPATSGTQLYVQEEGGVPQYPCILPGGTETPAPECSAGSGEGLVAFGKTRLASVIGALSADGKRLYWSDSSFDTGKIYLRENPLAAGPECSGADSPCTVAVSAAGEALSGASKSHFWAGASNGSAALFTANGDLYLFEVSGAKTKKIAGLSAGVLGASKDLSRIYFASREEIGGEGIGGKPNLYLYEAGEGGVGSYRFIATLAEADVTPILPGGRNSATAQTPANHNGQASADGLAATFISTAPLLTGYDNTDAASAVPCGQPGGICDSEAYVYDANADGGEGELVCVSCNPTGGRPEGSGGTAARLPAYETSLYQPRVLFADGSRAFFESQDPLSPRDSNGRVDVYEWERAGTGRCDQTDPGYSAQDKGCVELLSSGQAKIDAGLLDADAGGENVFFTTIASLVPQDYGLVDVYDARVEGGLPSPPPPPIACEAECQNPPPSPAFQTPSTSQNEGPGNVVEPKKHKKKHPHHKKKKKKAQHKVGRAAR